jgi:metallo-beta-lactamase family protein
LDVKVKCLGGAGSVTGSKFLLEVDSFNVLVDCGLFQGLKELRLRNRDPLPIEPTTIHAVVLTHAHLDHTGYLPKLVKDGYNGPVYCTEATAHLARIILTDSAKLQEEEAEYARKKGYSKHSVPEPLYTSEDAEASFERLQPQPWNQPIEILPGITVAWHRAAHILGAAWVEIQLTGTEQTKTIVFSGDVGRNEDPLLLPPTLPQHADILLIESTYGNREVDSSQTRPALATIVREALDRKGVLLIPAFSVGRTQNLLVLLDEIWDAGLAPECPVFMDSPMAIETTRVYVDFASETKIPERLKEDSDYLARIRKHLTVVESREASRFLNDQTEGCIIISASGMMTGGRILHHLYTRLPKPQNTLLVSGYQAEGTRGRSIVEGESAVKIFGEYVPVKCHVAKIDGLSAHADRSELLDWVSQLNHPPKKTLIIHGEKAAALGLQSALEEKGWNNVIVPDYLESFHLFEGI